MKNTNTTHIAVVSRRIGCGTRIAGLLVGLLALSGAALATCNPNIPLTRLDSRYEAVTGGTPAGSEVRDKVTGLIWQRCVLGMAWNGTTCTGTASALTWQAALDAARTATASTVQGATAWRVPSHAELYSLPERACDSPAINTTWFPATPAEWTWSSSPNADSSDGAWVVNFSNGDGDLVIKSSANRVRLVRSGQ